MSGTLPIRSCRRCGCTDDDCSMCIARTGRACYWVEQDLCSACQQDRQTGWNILRQRMAQGRIEFPSNDALRTSLIGRGDVVSVDEFDTFTPEQLRAVMRRDKT
ncbi:MAG TPA: hypothetical protein VL614_15130 [Acetobacteraceae bacterium]|jgi:hypothetical protein|nr:hypothetical protein [Acetobacteraceae bacterium]